MTTDVGHRSMLRTAVLRVIDALWGVEIDRISQKGSFVQFEGQLRPPSPLTASCVFVLKLDKTMTVCENTFAR